jgi:hypothetical protein
MAAAPAEFSVDELAQRWMALGDGLWYLPVPAAAAREAAPDNAGWLHHLLLARDDRGGAGSRWWLVGSDPSPAFGAAVGGSIVRRFAGARVTDLVALRATPESVMGHAAFDGARSWALADVADEMRRRCPVCVERLRERLGAAGASLTPAAVRVPTHRLPGPRVRIGPFEGWAMRRGEDAVSLVLRHAAAKVWSLDGWLWPGGGPPDLREADPLRFAAGLATIEDRVRRLDGQQARLLGMDGPLAGVAAVAAHRAYLAALRNAVQAAMDRGEAEGTAAAGAATAMPASEAATVAADPVRHALNWQRMWRALEGRLFR